MINLAALIDDAKCYQTIRQLRWVDGVHCWGCDSREVIKRGKDELRAIVKDTSVRAVNFTSMT